MLRSRALLFYTLTIAVFSILIFFLLQRGSLLEQGPAAAVSGGGDYFTQIREVIRHNLVSPVSILLLQIITVLVVAKGFGLIFRKIGQPMVIGEIVAGIFLGPSFFGMYFPELSLALFPPASLSNLGSLSQIGLVLFMFIVGMELDLNILKNKAREAVVISHASIMFPFLLGVCLAFYIYPGLGETYAGFLPFALFIGIAMSITAFPVLARIVQERGLTGTRLGTISITCAAADDITAWCLLAVVIAIAKAGSVAGGVFTIVLAIIYVFTMLKLVKPFLTRISPGQQTPGRGTIAIYFLMLLASAYIAEVIGIHALFGAFMAGVIMPSDTMLRKNLAGKVEDVALVFLLPLFFVFTGLRTQIGLLNEPHLWKICAAITGVAILGKFAGSAIAAKVTGQSTHSSLSIGALMNTRGLMELVVLNIGYDLGILGPEIFAMFVIMALVTTIMTGPSLDLINRFFRKDRQKESPPEGTSA